MSELLDFATEHYILSTLWVVIVFLLIANLVKYRFSSVKVLSPQDATIATNRNGIFVDVRSEEEFAAGHIQGARHIPLEKIRAGETKPLEKFKDAPIVFVCNHGNQAKTASNIMAKQEYSEASVLQGGMHAWRNASFPVSKKKATGKKAK